MAVRINKAKNFKGKAYVAADELDNLIQTMTFSGIAGNHFGNNADNDWLVNFTTADSGATATAVDLTKIKDYIDGKSITVTAGDGITIDSETNPLSPTIATKIKLVKLGTATTGYAASYKLQVWDHTANSNAGDWKDAGDSSATIDIVKDQFLKGAVLGYGTYTDGMTTDPADWTTTQDGTKDAILKLMFNKNTDGNATDTEEAYNVYINVTGMFKDKTAGAYIDATALSSNVIKVNVGNGIDGTDTTAIKVKVDSASESVYTVKGTTAPVLSVGEGGVKISNIQVAINNAVTTEHLTASAAIEDLESDVLAFASNTSTAVTALNTRIEAVASNAATAAGNAQANAIAYASGVADNAQTAVQKVGSAVDKLDTTVSAAIDDVNTNVEAAIGSAITNVNTALGATVNAVNAKVGSAVTAVNTMVSGSIDSVNSSVGALKNTVSATVDTVSAVMESLAGDVNDAVTARNTQLASAVQVVDSEVTISVPANGEITTSVVATYILAVYGNATNNAGAQIYPEIIRGAAGTGDNAGMYTYTLSASYGSDAAAGDKDTKWNVICAKPLPTYTGSAAAVTGYSNTVAYTNAGKAADATYTDASKTDADAVNATDVTYTKGTAVAGTTVAGGSAGTDATTVDNGDAATAPATTGIAVTKKAPAYQNEP